MIPGFNIEAFLEWTQFPENTEAVFNMQKELLKAPRRPEMIQTLNQRLEASTEFMTLFRDKYCPRFPTMEELKSCPVDSLGQALYKHLDDNKISLDFAGLDTSMFYHQEVTPVAFLAMRAIRNHDIYHVVMGLGTSAQDEYYLLSYQLGQFASPYHMILVASGYLHTVFFEPEKVGTFLDAMNSFYKLGRTSKLLPGFPFENHLQTPLIEVQRQLGLKN